MKHILITGSPGIGKTTLIKRISDHLKSQGMDCSGFYTEEIRMHNNRVGFDIVTLNGEREILARKSENMNLEAKSTTKRPRVGQYEVYIDDFEKISLPVLENNKPIVIIDEIGKMELFSKKFENKVRDIFNNKNMQVIATVPIKGKLNIVEQLKQNRDCQLFTVTFSNRNNILSEILKLLPSQ